MSRLLETQIGHPLKVATHRPDVGCWKKRVDDIDSFRAHKPTQFEPRT